MKLRPLIAALLLLATIIPVYADTEAADDTIPTDAGICEETTACVHDYQAVFTEGNCQAPGFTTYTCAGCGDSYIISHDAFSEWSETIPDDLPGELLETKTQYRYADKVYTTSYDPGLSGWELVGSAWEDAGSGSIHYVPDWPAGFSRSHSLYTTYNQTPKSPAENATDKTTIDSDQVTGHLYYHWCRGTYTAGPINRLSKAVREGDFNTFHAFYSATDPDALTADSSGRRMFANADCCRDSYWFFHTPVHTQQYSTYRNLFSYQRWDDWSDWSDEVYTASESRMVETRLLYRLADGGHRYCEGYCTLCGSIDPDYDFGPAVIAAQCVSGNPGSTITVPVTVKHNPGIAGFTLALFYDQTALTLVDVAGGELLQGSGDLLANVSGGIVNWFHSENVTGDGVLLELEFQISAAGNAGEYDIGIALQNGLETNFVNEDSQAVPVTFTNGTVSGGRPGDLNLDGAVNSDDLTLLARHVGGIETLADDALAGADVNGDGEINSDDLTLHARYVGGIITDWNQA